MNAQVPKFKKLSVAQRRDFDYYLTNGRLERCYGNFMVPTVCHPHVTQSVEEWYWLWDTHGIECAGNQDTEAIKQIKAFSNLTVKLWVEQVLEMLLRTWEVYYYDDVLPWMKEAFRQQLERVGRLPIHRVQTWMKSEVWVPPWVLSFDPMI